MRNTAVKGGKEDPVYLYFHQQCSPLWILEKNITGKSIIMYGESMTALPLVIIILPKGTLETVKAEKKREEEYK